MITITTVDKCISGVRSEVAQEHKEGRCSAAAAIAARSLENGCQVSV